MGVFLATKTSNFTEFRLPHVRGGVSFCNEHIAEMAWSSPRAWGCFQVKKDINIQYIVFPTCVGVFLEKKWLSKILICLPHVRGGVSR